MRRFKRVKLPIPNNKESYALWIWIYFLFHVVVICIVYHTARKLYHVYAGVKLVSENEYICMHVSFLGIQTAFHMKYEGKIVIASNENDVIPMCRPDLFSLFYFVVCMY